MARILIVEDDPVNAELAALLCKRARHHVTVVENGVEALLVLDALPFDLILTDARMPKMDGLALTALIRGSTAAYAHLPIIGMTGRSEPDAVSAMLASGMDEVITKPFRHATLNEAVDKWLTHGRHAVSIFRAYDEAEDRLDA